MSRPCLIVAVAVVLAVLVHALEECKNEDNKPEACLFSPSKDFMKNLCTLVDMFHGVILKFKLTYYDF